MKAMTALVNTVGDTISMLNWLDGKPWFSHEVERDFRKWENGGGDDYYCFGEWLQVVQCMFKMTHFGRQPQKVVVYTSTLIENEICFKRSFTYSIG